MLEPPSAEDTQDEFQENSFVRTLMRRPPVFGRLRRQFCLPRCRSRRAALSAEPIKIGLVTALSGQSARAGEAITRGATIAIEEINAKGGVLGRPLELVRRDDESNPAKGLIAARELIQREKVAVLVGGLDTPVELAIVPFVNNVKVPFVVPWAAGTNITKNGAAVQLRVPRLRHG